MKRDLAAERHKARVDKRQALGESARRTPLVELIPKVIRGYDQPTHLAPLLDALERAPQGRVRLCASAPPRHAKSESVAVGIAQLFAKNPRVRIMYASYGASLALERSRRIRQLTRDLGVELASDQKSVAFWATAAGGHLIAGGVDGSFTGRGADILVIDDAHRNRSDAHSSNIRDRIYANVKNALFTRLEPAGSIIVLGARMHEDDLIGRLTNERFDELVLPALTTSADGTETPLWPARFDLDALHFTREEIGPIEWASLYQGQPRPAGSSMFEDVFFYDERPADNELKISAGVDLSYGSKSSQDWTAIVTLGRAANGTVYVLDVVRRKQGIDATMKTLRAHRQRWQVTPHWAAGGQERAIAELLTKEDIRINVTPATSDKSTRAQGASAAWARGQILVPRKADWLDAFIRELSEFPQSRNDDQVDAFGSAFNAVAIYGGSSRPLVPPRRADSNRLPPGPGGGPGPLIGPARSPWGGDHYNRRRRPF